MHYANTKYIFEIATHLLNTLVQVNRIVKVVKIKNPLVSGV